MVQRRLVQPASNPAPAPSQPAATPTPATAVLEPPPAAPAQPTPATGTALATVSPATMALFQSLGNQTAATPELVAGSSTPYVIFFHERGGDARVIAQKFPQIADGDPILKCDGQFYDVKRHAFAILNQFQYWIKADNQGKPVAWSLTSKANWKEQVLTQLVQFSEVGPVLTLTGLRTAKCPIAKDMKNAHEEAIKGQGLGKDPRYGAMVQAGFPPAFRVVGTYGLVPKPGENAYVKGNAVTRLISDAEAQQVIQWLGLPETADEMKEIVEAFNGEVDYVKEKAATQR